ncbi:MAG: hypothetical protein ACKOEI_10370 [Chthoniobacterales bacterium]
MLTGIFPSNPVAALSGPNHAEEVARGTPAATGFDGKIPVRTSVRRFPVSWSRPLVQQTRGTPDFMPASPS